MHNAPHPYSPFQVVAVGVPGSHAWTVQLPGTGELASCRFARARQAEQHARMLHLLYTSPHNTGDFQDYLDGLSHCNA